MAAIVPRGSYRFGLPTGTGRLRASTAPWRSSRRRSVAGGADRRLRCPRMPRASRPMRGGARAPRRPPHAPQDGACARLHPARLALVARHAAPVRVRRRAARARSRRGARAARPGCCRPAPPRPQVVALHGRRSGSQLPVAQSRVTAIGYHAAADGALALDPVGTRRTRASSRRVVRSLFGGGGSGSLRWYQLDGGTGPATAALDVGAPPGTDVYSPVDGTVVGDHAVRARRQALRRADRHPADGQPVARRLGHAPAARPGARRSARTVAAADLEARHGRRLRPRRAPGARALHERRGQPRRRSRSTPRRRSVTSRLRILFVADVFGAAGPACGRGAAARRCARSSASDFCIVNGENVADGAGITPKLAERLLAAGADVITLGNHVWRRREIAPYLERHRARAPAGEPVASARPGAGSPSSRRGRDAGRGDQPARRALPRHAGRARSRSSTRSSRRRARAAPVVVVDFHAEATSEKVALARWLDGRVTAVIGTHTHVQTSDARVLAGRHRGDHRRRHDRARTTR